jgi:hypothetical protein
MENIASISFIKDFYSFMMIWSETCITPFETVRPSINWQLVCCLLRVLKRVITRYSSVLAREFGH